MISYQTVTEVEFNELEKNWRTDSNSIPRDCYVAKLKNGSYLAMDNSECECWVQECNSRVLLEEFFLENSRSYEADDYQSVEAIRHKEIAY